MRHHECNLRKTLKLRLHLQEVAGGVNVKQSSESLLHLKHKICVIDFVDGRLQLCRIYASLWVSSVGIVSSLFACRAVQVQTNVPKVPQPG